MREIYPDVRKKFVSLFWEDDREEISRYKSCTGEISCFISRLWEGRKGLNKNNKNR